MSSLDSSLDNSLCGVPRSDAHRVSQVTRHQPKMCNAHRGIFCHVSTLHDRVSRDLLYGLRTVIHRIICLFGVHQYSCVTYSECDTKEQVTWQVCHHCHRHFSPVKSKPVCSHCVTPCDRYLKSRRSRSNV